MSSSQVSIWYLGAILVFLYGVIGDIVIQYFVAKFTNDNFISVDRIIDIVATVAVCILLIMIGYQKNKGKKEQM